MHKLECSAMIAFKENWCPSEICRLVARILAKKVGQLIKNNVWHIILFIIMPLFPQKTMKERCASENILLIEEIQSRE